MFLESLVSKNEGLILYTYFNFIAKRLGSLLVGGCVNSLTECASGSRERKGMSGDNWGLIMLSECTHHKWSGVQSCRNKLEKEERDISDQFSEQIKLSLKT